MTQVHDDDPPLTRTSAAFGAREVGPPVSRLTTPAAVEVPAAPARCPSCASRVRAGQPWCLLCHADLRLPGPPDPVVAVHTAEAAAAVVPAVDPAVDPEHDRSSGDGEQLTLDLGGARPAGSDVAAPGSGLDEEEVERMLRHLATSGIPRVRGLDSRQARIAVAVGGGVGLTALLLGGMAVLGGLTG